VIYDPKLCDEVAYLQVVVADIMEHLNVSCRALVMHACGGDDDNTFEELRRWVAQRTGRTVRGAGYTRIWHT